MVFNSQLIYPLNYSKKIRLLFSMMILQIGLSRCLKNNWTMIGLKLMHLLNFLFLWCQRQALILKMSSYISPISFFNVFFSYSLALSTKTNDKQYLAKSLLFSFFLYWFFLFYALVFFFFICNLYKLPYWLCWVQQIVQTANRSAQLVSNRHF